MSVSRWVIDLGLKMNELNVKEKAVEVSNINVQMKETSIENESLDLLLRYTEVQLSLFELRVLCFGSEVWQVVGVHVTQCICECEFG